MSDIFNELTQEQIQELLSVSQRIREQDIRGVRTETDLPEEIQAELDETPPSELKQKIKTYARHRNRYNGGRWTQSGAVNKVLLPEIKTYQVEATQAIEAFHEGGNRLRSAARAATEIYGISNTSSAEGNKAEDVQNRSDR